MASSGTERREPWRRARKCWKQCGGRALGGQQSAGWPTRPYSKHDGACWRTTNHDLCCRPQQTRMPTPIRAPGWTRSVAAKQRQVLAPTAPPSGRWLFPASPFSFCPLCVELPGRLGGMTGRLKCDPTLDRIASSPWSRQCRCPRHLICFIACCFCFASNTAFFAIACSSMSSSSSLSLSASSPLRKNSSPMMTSTMLALIVYVTESSDKSMDTCRVSVNFFLLSKYFALSSFDSFWYSS